MGISLNKKHGSQGVAEEVNQRFRTGDSYTSSFEAEAGLVYNPGSDSSFSLSTTKDEGKEGLPFGVKDLFDHDVSYDGSISALIGSKGSIDLSDLNIGDRALLVFDFDVECKGASFISSSFVFDLEGEEFKLPGISTFIPEELSGTRIPLQSSSVMVIENNKIRSSFSLPCFRSNKEALVFPKKISLIILR